MVELKKLQDFAEETHDVKINIRGLMISSGQKTMTYLQLIQDYRRMLHEEMPCCGFKTQVELLKNIPDVLEILPVQPGELALLRLVPSAKSEHLAKLVDEQKIVNHAIKKKTFPSAERLNSIGVKMPPRDIPTDFQGRCQPPIRRPRQRSLRQDDRQSEHTTNSSIVNLNHVQSVSQESVSETKSRWPLDLLFY